MSTTSVTLQGPGKTATLYWLDERFDFVQGQAREVPSALADTLKGFADEAKGDMQYALRHGYFIFTVGSSAQRVAEPVAQEQDDHSDE